MKERSRIFVLLSLALLVLLFSAAAFADDPPTSGTLPKTGQTWEVNGTTLTITGEGSMEYFRYEEDIPWAPFADRITEVILDERITSISYSAFEGFSALKTIDLPDGMEYIESSAFSGCSALERIEIPKGARIGGQAFANCPALTEAVFYGDEFEQSAGMGSGYFYRSPNVTIKGYERSRACLMARIYNLPFESMGESPDMLTVYVTPADDLDDYVRRSHTRVILADGFYSEFLQITGCDISFEAAHPGKAELLSSLNSFPVVKIEETGFITLSGLILGHRETSLEDSEGACGGGTVYAYSDPTKAQVVTVSDSLLVNIDQCDLWGCGLNAVFLTNSTDSILITNSVLRDCVYGAVYSRRSSALFQNCVISGNAYHEGYRTKPCIYGDTVNALTFEGCRFLCNENPTRASSEDAAVFTDCVFYDNAWQGAVPGTYGVCLGGVVWEVKDKVLYLGQDHVYPDQSVLASVGEDIPPYSPYSSPWKRCHIERIADYYEVTFYPNGGYLPYEADSGRCTRIVANGKEYGALPEPRSSDGYEFLGWYTEKLGGEKIESSSTVDLTGPQTLYAHWKWEGTLKRYDPETDDFVDTGISWRLSDDGTVFIDGQGEMPRFQLGLSNYVPYHSVVIGEGITSLDDCSFYGSTTLADVYLPRTLKKIESAAFMGCENLKNVYYSGTEAEWKAVQIESLFPDDQKELENAVIHYAAVWGVELELPADLTRIEEQAFAGLKYMTFRLPGSVSYISPSAFEPGTTLVVPAGSAAEAAARGLNVTLITE